jgi:hypothetical protein
MDFYKRKINLRGVYEIFAVPFSTSKQNRVPTYGTGTWMGSNTDVADEPLLQPGLEPAHQTQRYQEGDED